MYTVVHIVCCKAEFSDDFIKYTDTEQNAIAIEDYKYIICKHMILVFFFIFDFISCKIYIEIEHIQK